MSLKGILFGTIGTLVETSEMQRAAFNAAFALEGIAWYWGRSTYQPLLDISGGRNRIRHYAEKENTTLTEQKIKDVHETKSRIYQYHIQEYGLALRPGVSQLIHRAFDEGIKLAFASTTPQKNIEAIAIALGNRSPYRYFNLITNADTVKNRKPAPDVYLHVLNLLELAKDEVIAIENTQSNVRAAILAGIRCVATPGENVQHQDFSTAVAVAKPAQIANLDWMRSLLSKPSVV